MNDRRVIAAMVLSYALLGILMNSVGVVILQSLRHFAVSKAEASSLEACKDLSVVAASFLLASHLPRFGFRRAMVTTMAVIAAGSVAISLADDFWATRGFFVLTGLCFGAAKIATYASIGLLRQDRAGHASLTGFVEGMFMVGVLAGIWTFGWFIGHDGNGRDWLRVYWLIAALSALSALLWAAAPLDERLATPAADATAQPGWRVMAVLAALPATIAFLAAIFFYVLVEQSVGTWLPTFNAEVLHLPPAMSVQASTIYIAALAAGRLGASVALRRVGWVPLLLGCLAATALLVVTTLPLARGVTPRPDMGWLDAPAAAFVFPLIGVFMAPVYPTLCSAMLTTLPSDRHATMVGLIVIFSALGGTIGSFVTGLIFQQVSGATAFYLTLLPLGLIALALMAFARATHRAAETSA